MHNKEQKMEAFGRLLDIMDALREKCPWNAEQTMDSIRPMTEEEVYELSDAIIRKESQDISKEIFSAIRYWNIPRLPVLEHRRMPGSVRLRVRWLNSLL